MGERGYFNIVPGTVDRRRFAKPQLGPNVAMYILQKPLQLWDDTSTREDCAYANVETASSAGSTAPTKHIFYISMFRDRKVNFKATPDCSTGAVLPLLA